MGEAVRDESSTAYMAGLFDGEGSIKILRRKHGSHRNTTYNLQARVAMTVESPIRRLQQLFGGRVTGPYKSKQTTKSGRPKKPFWSWDVNGKEVKSFLAAVMSYLDVKREEARKSMEFPMPGKGHALSPKQRKFSDELYHTLRELKGTGYCRPDAVTAKAVVEVK